MRSVLKYGALALLSATLASPVALAQMSGNNGQPGGTASGQSNDQATHNGWSQNGGAQAAQSPTTSGCLRIGAPCVFGIWSAKA